MITFNTHRRLCTSMWRLKMSSVGGGIFARNIYASISALSGCLGRSPKRAQPTLAVPPYGKKYAVSDEAHRMTQKILDHHGLEGEARIEMDRVIRHLFHYAETRGCRCSDITHETLMDFFVNELPKTNKGSMGRALRAIKYVSEYMKTCGFSQLVLDFSQLNAGGSHVRVIQPYSSEEVGCMLESVDTSTGAGMRDYAIMLLAFETGLRGVDIRKIKLSDIDWRHGRIRICQNKTSEPLILPLTGRAMNAIADYALYYVHLLPEKLRRSAKIDWSQFSVIYGKDGIPDED